MSTISEIDNQHMEYIVGDRADIVTYRFKPGKYQTYGSARKAIKDILGPTGYPGLTHKEKEIVGRWNLINDQEELDNLFGNEEQTAVINNHKSHKSCLVSSKLKQVKKNSYFTIDQIRYDGSTIDEIDSIKVVSRATKSSTTYAIRVYDVINREVVAEKTDLNNTESQINDLGDILYQPSTDTFLEIQVKNISGNGKVSYESISIEYLI